jgi:hypothetical protein
MIDNNLIIACKDKTPDYAGMRPFKKKGKPNNILQEWRDAPTAVAYADGQMSGPSAYVRSRAAAQRAPRRRHTLGVETDTPTATLGVLKAVGVLKASAPVPLRP